MGGMPAHVESDRIAAMMKKCLVLAAVAAMGALAEAATNAWPFAILRCYGTYEQNRDFFSRVFAAQERHPGLVNEIWFSGVKGDLFGDPDRMGEGVAELNLAAKPICEKLGIAFSYQHGVTLNHAPDDLPHPGIPDDAWAVDRDGRRRSGLFCCTSPFALDFAYRKAKSIMAAIRPDSYWPDDDLRLATKVDWHRSNPDICFCERCLRLFGARTGRTHTRESLLAELDPGAGANAATRKAWCDFNAESLAAYAAAIRRAAEEVSPKTRLGIQVCDARYTCSGNAHERFVATFAGKDGLAGIRPGGGVYTDLLTKYDLFGKLLNVAKDAAQASRLAKAGQICYEAENWPHIGAIKSPGGMMAECALSMAFGCDSISFYWGADQNGEPSESYDFFLETMHRWRPFHLAVRDAFRGTWLGGVAIRYGSDVWADPNWHDLADGCLNRLVPNGLPVTVEEAAPDVQLLTSRTVKSLAKADLAKVFARPALMDPAAFATLSGRFPELEFARKLKVVSLDGERALATIVRANGYEKFAKYGKCESVQYFLYPQTDDVIRLSEMTADPKACGTCIVPTEFGGKVVVALDATGEGAHLCWPGCRRHAILDALDMAVPGGMPVRLLTDGYAVSVSVRKTDDGRTAGVFLLNLGTGETPPLELAIRRGAGKDWTAKAPKAGDVAVKVREDGAQTILRLPPLDACEPLLVTHRP